MAYISVPTDRYIPSTALQFTTGTWTQTNSGNLLFALKTAAAETSVVALPLSITRRSGFNGVVLTSVTWLYRCTTADLTAAPTATIHRIDASNVTSGATTTLTPVQLTTTTSGVVTASANDRSLTTSVATPAADGTNTGVHYLAQLTLAAAAGSVIRVYGAVLNITELT